MNEIAIERFVEYLRIKTDHPNPDYGPAVKFLKAYADELGLPAKVVEVYKDKPVVVVTWKGKKHGRIGSILLNSHMDVVVVDEEKWTYPPFEARRVDGKIYARGAQDMKVVGVQYMEAIRRLKNAGFQPKRTVHLTFVPDEEIGGASGMKVFVKTREFIDLHVAFALDEGIPSPTNAVSVFYSERLTWWIRVRCSTDNETAGEKLWRFVDKLMSFRKEQLAFSDLCYKNRREVADKFSINLTMLDGNNEDMTAVFDIRIPPSIDVEKFEKQLEKWRHDVANNCHSVCLEFLLKDTLPVGSKSVVTATFWPAFRDALKRRSLNPRLAVRGGMTDSRFLRQVGIPALGFSPLVRSKNLLHADDEHIDEEIFLEGIHIYEEIVRAITDVH